MGKWDLATFGSTMLSLSTDAGVPLASSDSLRVDIAGAESNVAIALAGLGKKVTWLSQVGDTPVGERIVSEIRARDVDVSRVKRVEGRNELMLVEAGAGSNRTNVVYDRARAAIEDVNVGELDLSVVEQSRWFHFTGITLGLSGRCARVIEECIDLAKRAGVKISCDVNYRSKVWKNDVEAARAAIERFLPEVDLLLVGDDDYELFWGRKLPRKGVAEIAQEFGISNVVMTCGADGAVAQFDGSEFSHPAFSGDVVSPIGAGDAFAAGLLYSLMKSDVKNALKRGNAMATLARGARSDYVVSASDRLEAFLSGRNGQLSR